MDSPLVEGSESTQTLLWCLLEFHTAFFLILMLSYIASQYLLFLTSNTFPLLNSMLCAEFM